MKKGYKMKKSLDKKWYIFYEDMHIKSTNYFSIAWLWVWYFNLYQYTKPKHFRVETYDIYFTLADDWQGGYTDE